MAAVNAKRGYVGMCNGRSAQQESGAALSKNSMFTAGAKNYMSVCLSVCLLPRFLPLRETRRPISDTNGSSATLALFLK